MSMLVEIEEVQLPPSFIGVFDSGAGGISVLNKCCAELPGEDFVYFGDTAYTPYGEKPDTWILERSCAITESLVQKGAKAIVIACNTATSAAATALRDEFPDVPIIGVEPALKPATEAQGIQDILVMATPMTLHLHKYRQLAERLGEGRTIDSVECPGLAARIEQGDLDAHDIDCMLQELIGSYRGKADAVVLGCTHYVFIAPAIRRVMGEVPLFDGARGTARQLRRKLEEAGALTPLGEDGRIIFISSEYNPHTIELYESFLERARNTRF